MARPMGAGAMREEVTREVEQFLYREARLLDERRFHEWLALFTDDVHYWMGARANRYPRNSKALSILDETKETLAGRVARLETGMAWAEDPPSRTRHVISNIEVADGDTASELTAYSN